MQTTQIEVDGAVLVRRCLEGDGSAWAELVRLQHGRVYGLCLRFTGNAADADDLSQDVFLRIYSNLSSFDATRGSLPVWIATIARNLLVDHFRRTKNLRLTSSLDANWDDRGGGSGASSPARSSPARSSPAIDRLEAKGRNQHDAAAHRELAEMVHAALAQVTVELREAVILRDLQDMDYREIAVVLGIPEGTVKSRISRGRAELARRLARNGKQVQQ